MFKALFRVLLCYLKGQKKFVYCESGREEVLLQAWLRVHEEEWCSEGTGEFANI